MYSSTIDTNIIPSSEGLITINPKERGALVSFTSTLSSFFDDLYADYSRLVILCIGSDRSTGDALGPLVGSMLAQLKTSNAIVMGNLEKPVHALNLKETKNFIDSNYDAAAILAVDACLGNKNKIGHVEVGKGSLLPGAAVKKRIPPIGNLYVTGVVNVGGFMELMVLQSTRLHVVVQLARFIGWGIHLATESSAWDKYSLKTR